MGSQSFRMGNQPGPSNCLRQEQDEFPQPTSTTSNVLEHRDTGRSRGGYDLGGYA